MGAQHLVAPNYLLQALLESFNVEGTPHPHNVGDVVGGGTRRELVEKPHLLLAERKPRWVGRFPAGNGLLPTAQAVGS